MQEENNSRKKYLSQLAERRKRWRAKKATILKQSNAELIEAAVPIFVSAALVGCTAEVISVITDDLILKAVLFLIYSLVAFFVGKHLVYVMSLDETEQSTHFIFQTLRKYKLAKLFRSISIEHAGFAINEFMILLTLELTFDELGWGPAFGVFISFLFILIFIILLTDIIQRKILKYSENMNKTMLNFDAEAFPLSVAFISQSLIAIGFYGIGVTFINEDSYFLSYDEELAYQPHSDSRNPYYFYYAIIVSFITSILHSNGYVSNYSNSNQNNTENQINEDNNGNCDTINPLNRTSTSNDVLAAENTNRLNEISRETDVVEEKDDVRSSTTNLKENESERKQNDNLDDVSLNFSELENERHTSFGNHSSVDSLNWDVIKNVLICPFLFSENCKNSFYELWDNSLGYSCGVAWFVFVIDTFKVGMAFKNSALTSFFVLLVTASFFSWYGPRFITAVKVRKHLVDKKHAARIEKRNKESSKNNNNRDNITESETEFSPEEEIENRSIWVKYWHQFLDLYVGLRQTRRDILTLSMKLTVGWLWEVVVSTLFYLLGTEKINNPAIALIVEILITFFILIIGILLYLKVQEWEEKNNERNEESNDEIKEGNETVEI